MRATPSRLAPAAALDFILAGDARFTVVSTRTGCRYTFRVAKADDQPGRKLKAWFVSFLTGPENDSDYTYLGMLQSGEVRLTAKSKLLPDSGPVVAIRWLVSTLDKGVAPASAEIWHTGHCGRCGRLLTVPESVASGFGPECSRKRMAN